MAAAGLRWALIPFLGPTDLRYITFFPAIILAATYAGYLSGLLALMGGILVAAAYFTAPVGRATLAAPEDLAGLVVFAMVGGLSVHVGAALLRARGQAEQNANLARAHAAEAFTLASRSAADVRALEAEMAQRAEAEAATKRLQLHLAHSPLAVIEWDAESRVTRWEGEAERLFGYAAHEVLGRPLADLGLVHPDDVGQAREVSERLTAGREPVVVSRSRNLDREGRVLHCEWYNSSARGTDGRVSSILSLVLDVTRARQREAEREQLLGNLAAERARLRAVVDQMPAAVLLREAPSGRLLLQNAEAERLMAQLALSPAEPLDSEHPFRRLDGTGYAPAELPIAQALGEGRIIRGERMVCSLVTGEARVLSVSAGPVRDERGQVVAAVMSFVDMTSEYARLAALEESDRRFRSVTEAAPGIVWMGDTSGWPTYVNPAWERYTGCTLADLHRRGWESFCHPEELATIGEGWSKALAGFQPYELHFRYRRHDGVFRLFLGRAIAVRDARGDVIGWAAVAIEVHEQQRRGAVGAMAAALEGARHGA